jgi:hypothetical protein
VIDLDKLGIWVGLLGGFSGFAALYLQGWSTYIATPRVSLQLTFAINPSNGKKFYSVEVVNRGGKPITLNNLGIRFNNEMHSPFMLYPIQERIGDIFPVRLDSHSSKSWLFGEEATKSGVRDLKADPEIRAYLQLATGKEKVSKKLTVL